MGDYFNKPINNYTRSYFSTLDKNGEVLHHEDGVSCFASLTYSPVPKEVDSIDVRVQKSETGYNESSIVRWISDLQEMGFKIEYTGLAKGEYHFLLRTKDFKGKVILCITLQLIRYLSEAGLSILPEKYFTLVDDGEDKFTALQKAHTLVKGGTGYGVNPNHSSRELDDKNIISKDKFWENISKDKTTLSSQLHLQEVETNKYWK